MPPATHDPLADILAHGRRHFVAGEYPTALEAFAEALRRDPRSPEALARLAATHARLERWPEAESGWRRLLALQPGLTVARTGLGIALREQNRLEEALAVFVETTTAHPELAPAHFNLGTCLMRCDRPLEATKAFKTALALDAHSPQTRFSLALALLKAGRFVDGALAYEARWKHDFRDKKRPFHGPRWTGRALPPGEPLVLWGEQGIGDEIMFAGLLPAAVPAAAGRVFVECAPRLVPLFARSFPEVRVVARNDPPVHDLPTDAAQCPLGSLPALLWSAVPAAPPPYLVPDPESVSRMRARLAALGPGPKVGIVWRGGHPAANRPRFISAEHWQPFFHDSAIVPICLQHGPAEAELEQLATVAGRPLHRIPDIDPLRDMDSFAALIAALDAVVGADNSTIHLAGALGTPTALLLNLDSDWRWGVEGVPCPWYRGVVRLRQKTPGDWAEPMATAAGLVAGTAPPAP